MKRFALFVMLLVGLVSGVNAANTPVEPTKALQEKVDGLLENYNNDLSKDVDARIVFAVTQKNELLVVDVQTEDEDVEKFIKSTLNYQAVEGIDGVQKKLYTMHVTFKAE
ncbi:MAG: hypothetical protein ACPGR7_02320 [Flavobacteriaceae bacterium]